MEKILLNNRSDLRKAYDFFGAKNRDRINQVLREFPCIAGWSSSANEKPFLTAFYKFMNTMENKR